MFTIYIQVKQIFNYFLAITVWLVWVASKTKQNQTEMATSSWYNAAMKLIEVGLSTCKKVGFIYFTQSLLKVWKMLFV